MRQIFFAVGLIAAAAIFAAPVAARAEERKPNILVIVADDLGWGELGCQGGKDIPTPNIDAIAREGARFTSGYVSCPVCSPTRAGLLTGRYQQRFGHEFNPGPAEEADAKFGLPLSEKTLADRLKAGGYATGMVGKWHLGYEPEYHPQKRGFDEYFGFLGGAHGYMPGGKQGPRGAILRGTEEVQEKEYLTDALAREAVAYIEKHKEHPFFLYLPFNAVHAPLQAPAKYLDRFKNIENEKRRTFAAMLSAQDDAVGAVMGKIKSAGLDESTLVFYIADNGGPTKQTSSSNGPLRGFKGQTFEGGIRVPYMMRWKGKIPEGQVLHQPVIALDIAPTALAAAGIETPADAKFDGASLLPIATGKSQTPPHEALYWRFGEQAAIRKGDMKLVEQPGPKFELHDLGSDIGEAKDLSAEKPEVVRDLKKDLDAWKAQLETPKWKRGGEKGQPKKKMQGERRKGAGKKRKAKAAQD